MKLLKASGLFVVLAAAGLILNGCSDDTSGSSSAYAGPGSDWSMIKTGLNGYSFTMTDGSDSMTITATGSELASGHTKLTVTDVAVNSGSPSTPSIGEVAHSIEVDGTAFLLKPLAANSETIAMVTAGECPGTFTSNWVIGARSASAGTKITDNDKDWFGSIIWDTSAGTATFPLQRSVENGGASSGEGSSQAVGTCENGRVSNSGANIEAYFTQSGMAIVATNVGLSDESHIIGVPQAAISAASEIHGNYIGFIFDQENNDTFAVSATMAAGTGASGDISINVLSGSNLDTVSTTYTAQMGAVDNPGTGFVTGQFSTCTGGSVTNFDGTCELSCAVSKNVNNSGKTMMFCVGQHPSDEDDRITILLFEKD